MMILNIKNGPEPRKLRTLTIVKQEVYDDIDLYTHKHIDASPVEDARMRNAMSSDSSEAVDGKLIARFVEFRDAQIRRRISLVLAPTTSEEPSSGADNGIEQDAAYIYRLSLEEGFRDDLLAPLAEYIHRYLVYGTLYDWYAQFGDGRQASVYGQELAAQEEDINSLVRGRSIVKRPLRPFGPARRPF